MITVKFIKAFRTDLYTYDYSKVPVESKSVCEFVAGDTLEVCTIMENDNETVEFELTSLELEDYDKPLRWETIRDVPKNVFEIIE